MSQFQPESIAALIDDYGLNTERIQTEMIVAAWLEQYEPGWIVKAIVEAVFRGRYQLKSVDDILKQWQRLGKPRCSFKSDFERERLKKFSAPTELGEATDAPNSTPLAVRRAAPVPKRLKHQLPVTSSSSTQNYRFLNPEELEPFHHHHRLVGIPQPCHQQPLSISAPLQPQTEDLQTYLTHPSAAANNGASIKSAAINTPPRWWLLDKLKIAIGVEERQKTAVNAAEIPAEREPDKADDHHFDKQPQSPGKPIIQNTSSV